MSFPEQHPHTPIIKTHRGPTERVKLCISRIFVICNVAAVPALSVLCFYILKYQLRTKVLLGVDGVQANIESIS